MKFGERLEAEATNHCLRGRMQISTQRRESRSQRAKSTRWQHPASNIEDGVACPLGRSSYIAPHCCSVTAPVLSPSPTPKEGKYDSPAAKVAHASSSLNRAFKFPMVSRASLRRWSITDHAPWGPTLRKYRHSDFFSFWDGCFFALSHSPENMFQCLLQRGLFILSSELLVKQERARHPLHGLYNQQSAQQRVEVPTWLLFFAEKSNHGVPESSASTATGTAVYWQCYLVSGVNISLGANWRPARLWIGTICPRVERPISTTSERSQEKI